MNFRFLKQKMNVVFLFVCFLSISNSGLFANVLIQKSAQEKRDLIAILDEIGEKFKVFFNYESNKIANIKVNFELSNEENLSQTVKRLMALVNLEYDFKGEKFIIIYTNNRKGRKSAKKAKRKIGRLQKLEKKGDITIQRNNQNAYNRSINILERASSFQKNEKTIKGIVQNVDGDALIGANVIIKGTTTGTVIDTDGKYNLKVPITGTLVFSYIGYKDQEISVDNQTVIDVTLVEDLQSFEEVVVVGYGAQRKVDVTGAVGSIKADFIAKTPILSPDQALRGRLAGVQITSRSGAPAAPINVRIRGIGTIGNNSPLYVIDGVPIVQTTNITVNTASNTEGNPLAGINPSDIESMDVLKDASAAAIYGNRAANGVIIITTKRGKAGRTSLTYDGYYGIQTLRKKIDVLDVQEYIALQSQIGNDFSAFSDKPYIDWQEASYRTAGMQNHSIAASGGTENVNFNISGGYFKQDGISLASSFERYSVTANSDFKIGNNIKVGESLHISFTDRLVLSEEGNEVPLRAATNAPFVPIYENGDFTKIDTDNAGLAASSTVQLIGINDLSNNEVRILSRRMLGSLYAEVELLQHLTFKTQWGLDYTNGQGSWFSNNYDFGSDFKESITQVISKPTELTTNITNTLTFDKSFNNIHLNVLFGHEETNFDFDKLRGQGLGFTSAAVTLVNTATTSTVVQEKDKWALRGYLSRLHLNFRDKYLITAAIRKDATSRFAKNNRSDIFPSFSVGWKLSEEPFLQSYNFINELKIRAAWGQAGNQFTSNSSAYLSTLGLTSGYVLGTGQQTVWAPTPFVFANPNLKWETSTQIDVGIDASLWEGKLVLNLDYYQKNTTDILVGLPISALSGFLLPPDVNVGEIQNKGIECSLLYRNKIGKVNYHISGNFTTVNNKVLDLGENANPIITGYFGEQTHRTTVGFPISHFYGYKTNGLYQNQAEVDAALPDEFGTPSSGDIRFVDLNKDGKVTPLDRTFLGTSTPKAFYGFSLDAKYKEFDCSIFLQGVAGVKVFNNAARTLTSMNSPNNQSITVLDRWNGAGTSHTIPRATLADPNGNNRFSDRFVEDASYLRVQNLQVGYTMRQSALQKISNGLIQQLRFYVAASNLFTFTKYSGLDPEVTRGFSFQKGEMPLANGQDDGNIPMPRIVQFGAKAIF